MHREALLARPMPDQQDELPRLARTERLVVGFPGGVVAMG